MLMMDLMLTVWSEFDQDYVPGSEVESDDSDCSVVNHSLTCLDVPTFQDSEVSTTVNTSTGDKTTHSVGVSVSTCSGK